MQTVMLPGNRTDERGDDPG